MDVHVRNSVNMENVQIGMHALDTLFVQDDFLGNPSFRCQ